MKNIFVYEKDGFEVVLRCSLNDVLMFNLKTESYDNRILTTKKEEYPGYYPGPGNCIIGYF